MKTTLISTILLIFFASKSFSQNLRNDDSFAPSINGSFLGSGVNGDIRSSVIQPDGKIIIAGNFTTVDGLNRNCIARLLPNGDIDPTFVSSFEAFTTTVFLDMAIQSDGKIVVVGGVYPLGSVDLPSNSREIMRLNTDGTIDQTFLQTIPSGAYFGVEYLSSGKLIVSGSFTNVNGYLYNCIARLNTDGSPDLSFAMGTGPNNVAWDVKEESNGKLLVAGSFTQFNGIAYSGIVRLDANGTIDPTFLSPGSNLFNNTDFRKIAIQSTGKYLVSGRTQMPSLDYRPVLRFNTDGTLDATFNPNGDYYQLAEICAVQSDDKIIVAGDITSFNGQPVGHLFRLNPNGTMDMTFAATNMLDDIVRSVQVLPGDSLIVTGEFAKFGYRGRASFFKTSPNGQIVDNFPNVEGFNNSVTKLKVLPDDKIVAIGDFTYFEQYPVNHIEKLTANGEHDPGFISGSGFNGKVKALYVQNDGKLIVGGEFTSYNGNNANKLCRLNPNGTFDNTYTVTVNGKVNGIKELPNGDYYLVGDFTTVNGSPRNRIVQLNPSGTINSSFNVGTGFNLEVYNLDINNVGQLVVYGNFTQFKGASAYKVALLDNLGNVLPGTSTSLGIEPQHAAFQNDTTIIYGMYNYNGSAVLKMDFYGNVDQQFNDVFAFFSEQRLNALSIQADGRLILQGRFQYMDQFGIWQNLSIIRTSPEGLPETDFQTGYLGMVNTGDFQSNGKLVCGGSFSGIGVNNRNRIARIITCATHHVQEESSCSSYTWINGITYTASTNTPTFILEGSNGCDSIIHLDLTILNPSNSQISETACDSFTWLMNGQTYTNSGQYSDTIMNAAGCDSIITLDLTINHSATVVDIQTACDSLIWIDGNTYTSSTTTPTFVLQTVTNCDSIVTLNLTIIPSIPLIIENSFSLPSDANSCVGEVAVTVSGNADFELDLDNGSQVITSSGYSLITNLCAGIHDLKVTDHCGDTLSTQIVISVDSNYVFNNPFIDSLAIDSLGVTATNCDIYYNGIDTAYIDSIWANGNTVNVIWNIVDSNGSNFDTTTYVLNNGNGVYWLQLSIFCPNKSLGEYFGVTEAIYFNNGSVSTAGLSDYKQGLFEVYPNPTNNQVHLSFSGSDAELTVYDLQGKVVLKDRIQNQGTVSLENFERGVYLFDFRNSLGQSVQRVVKQ